MNRNPINQRPILQTNDFFTEPTSADPPVFTDSELGISAARSLTPASCMLRFMEWLLISGLLIVLFAPLAGKLLGWPQAVDLKENRLLAPRPDFRKTAWNKLPSAIDQWWNDRFAFRTQLIPFRETIWLDLLSAPGKQYIRGKDEHLFMNLMKGEKFHGSQNATVLDYLGENRLTEEQLSNWTDYLEGKNAWLLAHGIRYLFVISPNKISVQERFLPNVIRMAKGKSYLQQLREQVFPRLTQNVDLLDLTDVLIAKENETGIPMFSRTNDVAHWNGAGFYEGLVAMDKRIRRYLPDMPPFPEDKLKLIQSAADPTVFSCKWDNDPTVHGTEETIITTRTGDWTDSKCSEADGRKGNLVLFSDSSWKCYCGGLDSFLPATHTAFPYQWGRHRHADIYHATFNELQRIVRKERPDVVVEAQTERALTIPTGIGIPTEFRLAARFARGKTIHLWSNHEPEVSAGACIDGIKLDNDAFYFNFNSDNGPALEAPHSFRISEGSEVILRIDMDVAAVGTLQIFWSSNDTFSADNSVTAFLETGRNVLFQAIPKPAETQFHLCIVPGTVSDNYRIYKIEIRSTPRG